MNCPYYLLCGTLKGKSGDYYSHEVEVHEDEVNIEDYKSLKDFLYSQRGVLAEDTLVTLILIENSTEGGPKVIGSWA